MPRSGPEDRRVCRCRKLKLDAARIVFDARPSRTRTAGRWFQPVGVKRERVQGAVMGVNDMTALYVEAVIPTALDNLARPGWQGLHDEIASLKALVTRLLVYSTALPPGSS